MKRAKVGVIFVTIFILVLTACNIFIPNKGDGSASKNKTVLAAASTLLAQTMTAIPPSTATPASTLPSPISTHTPGPTFTPWPDFEPTQIPGLLESALTIEDLPGFNGHALQRVSGWKYGFDRVEWLDADHLVLYPYAGVTNLGADSMGAGTYPAVLNRASEQFWIPYLDEMNVQGRASLPKSAQLGLLITPNYESVAIYRPDGTLLKSYPGRLLGVSPSGTKILVGDGTWVDLKSGRTVNFAWQPTSVAADYASYGHSTPVWSPDEMRVFNCCYTYGNARTGESLVMSFDEVTVDGEKIEGSLLAYGAIWVMNDQYILPWGGYWEGPLFSVYLFDPLTKTFRDVGVVTGIPHGSPNGVNTYCDQPSAQNGGRYIWVDCQDGSHLINMATFQTWNYSAFAGPDGINYSLSDEKWSADGTFILLGSNLFSGATGEMKTLPGDCFDTSWHPKENVLLCTSKNGRKLSLVDAQTTVIQKEKTLPAAFLQTIWSPDGQRIALAANDDSLWQMDYPSLEHLEQLTAPLSELTGLATTRDTHPSGIKKLAWPADGTALAFVGAQDVYIVNTGKIP
jgi:WD40 repeat protein